MLTEKQVKDKVKAILKEFGVQYFMPPASIYGKAGVADFICCFRGHYIAIEAKSEQRGPQGLTALQERFGAEVKKAGGLYWVIWDQDCFTNMQRFLKRGKKL